MNTLVSLLALVRRGLAAPTDRTSPFAALFGLLRQIAALLLVRRQPEKIGALFTETEDAAARTLFARILAARGRTDIDPADYECRLVWDGRDYGLKVTPKHAGAIPVSFGAPRPSRPPDPRIDLRALAARRKVWRRRLRIPSRYTRKEQIARRFEQLARRRARKPVRRLAPRMACAVLAPP